MSKRYKRTSTDSELYTDSRTPFLNRVHITLQKGAASNNVPSKLRAQRLSHFHTLLLV
jgi:hypothetical protein